jgi:hypothetical protein
MNAGDCVGWIREQERFFHLGVSLALHFGYLCPMDLKKNIRFKIGSETWEMPLGVLLLLGGITLVLMVLGGILGFEFGKSVR